MKEPCRSCPRKTVDFGGCRCQALRAHRRRRRTPTRSARSRPTASSSTRRCASAERLDGVSLPRDRRAAAGVSAPRSRPKGSGATTATCARSTRSNSRCRAGALVGLLGPNGAGKTTAMLLLATLLSPTRGIGPGLRPRRGARPARRCGAGWAWCSRRPASTVSSRSRRTSSSPRASPASAGGSRARPWRTRSSAPASAPRARQPARELSGGWRRLARHRPRHAAPARSAHPRRADRRARPRAPRRRSGPCSTPSAGPTGPPCSSPPTTSRRPSRRIGSCCSPAAVSWRTTRRPRSAPSWARRSRRSRVPAPSDWRARSADSGAARVVLSTGSRHPRRHHGAARAGGGAGRRARRGSSASPCGPRRWRTCTSPAPRVTRRRRAGAGVSAWSTVHGIVARDLARVDPADQPAARRRGAPVHVAAAGGNRIQRHRPARERPSVSGVRLSGHRRDGGAVRRHAHRHLDRLRSRVRHAAADAGQSRRRPRGARGPGHRRDAGRGAPGRDRAGLRAAGAATSAWSAG